MKKKFRKLVLPLALAAVMSVPVIAAPVVPEGVLLHRAQGESFYVGLRSMAYAHGWDVGWDGEARTVTLSHADGRSHTITIGEMGSFIDGDLTWLPHHYAAALFAEAPSFVPEEVVKGFMNHILAGNYAAATMMGSLDFQQALVGVPLTLHVSGRHGTTLGFEVLGVQGVDGHYLAAIHATHVKGEAIHQILINSNGEIISFGTASFAFEPKMPPEGATYTAEALVIGEGTQWALDALLTVPEGASAENPVPVVILVPGSGANSMDSSLFENRPFFDIADYLSSNDIAVLRYNERSFTHGVLMSQTFGLHLSMWEEYVEDVILAAELMRADARISQVFVLGLSQGGLMAPRLAEEAGLDGTIIMNGSPRPFHQISYDQQTQFINDMVAAGLLSQADADAAFVQLAAMIEEAQRILALPESELPYHFVMGALPAVYERSIVESLPLPFIARNTSTPVLILQGSRDFQATVENDFRIFVDGTQGMDHVTLILYEGLNHLMMTAYRQYGPLVMDAMEYAIPGRMDVAVLRDIVNWINSNIN
ncbi:MAG: alpha/beta hydrolase [Defluviitaleaceae bacterium]|nr:alpha/beta hydrolase [Defluviitaleaceae bacterium]